MSRKKKCEGEPGRHCPVGGWRRFASHYPDPECHPWAHLGGASLSFNACWLVHLTAHLKQQGYSPPSGRHRLTVAERFLANLDQRHSAVEAVAPADVSLYLQNELQLFQMNRRRTPRSSMADWRRSHTAGIDMLLRLVHGEWPPVPLPSSPRALFIATCADSMTCGCAICAGWRWTPDPAAVPRLIGFSLGWKAVALRTTHSASRLPKSMPI